MIGAQGTLNCEQLEYSKRYDSVIARLHNLDLKRLEKVLFNKGRVQEIATLLHCISQVGLIGQRKWVRSSEIWVENHIRWVISDEQGRNIASSIYQIIVQDTSEYIRAIHGNHIKLICFGSVARGYATFPISYRLPVPKSDLNLMRKSDIDLYILFENTQNITDAVFSDIEARLDELASALPEEISFTVNKPNIIYSLEKFNTVFIEF